MKNTFILILTYLTLTSCGTEKKNSEKNEKQVSEDQEEISRAEALIGEVVEKVGGKDALRQKGDVEYEYTYAPADGNKDVSLERYVFDGEWSWAKYLERNRTLKDVDGEMIQGYDGSETWVTIDGEITQDSAAVALADFLRKTNYYWFAMMHKLLDPGLNYEYQGEEEVDGSKYDLVKLTFGENVGDAQDIYILYINKETKLIDQFLFTVMDFGRSEPLLMKVEYEDIDGVLLPTYRKYTAASWEAEPENDQWTEEISKNIKFGNSFEKSLFTKPN